MVLRFFLTLLTLDKRENRDWFWSNEVNENPLIVIEELMSV
jgi:hypothetical protein